MAFAQGNRLLPIIATAAALMAAFVLLRACGETEDTVHLREIPQAPAPDHDSPAETIRTLSAQVADMSSTFEALRTENETLRREQVRRESQLDREVSRRVQEELARHRDAPVRGLEGVMERIDRLSGRVEDLSGRPPSRAELEIPIGLGLEDDAPAVRMRQATPIRWVEPLGWDGNGAGTGATAPRRRVLDDTPAPRMERPVARATQVAAHAVPGLRPGAEADEAVRPVYTVPRNATLVGSTAMTALIGRIPRRGTVEDPMRFKIIQGRDNLAANGLTIPGVEGMVWSGTATGDWTLSCVRGQLDSVTFVFEDGTIRTLPDHDPAIGPGPGEDRDATGDQKPLGWISDERGYPCISGKRVTNAPQFLASRAGLIGLAAAGEAIAAGETTTTVTAEGTRIGTITGDQGRFIAGRTISGGADEVVRWLIERQEQSFDAVVTAAGVPVALHIDRELRIDYVPEPTGRRLTHETDRDYRTLRLD
ncbi:MAG: TIGR03752 family integrating conjugative element protein [Thioalkalivibrio sp.]|nr:MAG: TIGR03752 family integrating conjugative element protein [Thioalkalivibrio sp.]